MQSRTSAGGGEHMTQRFGSSRFEVESSGASCWKVWGFVSIVDEGRSNGTGKMMDLLFQKALDPRSQT